ncbi:hypothetical protein HELRODRAFT_183444 [Helobdella robusta]|uniref:RRM domain-containing protein n=1 Tax=Helobdella robusta TaxID=6412 RepID=T1FJN9_HELRO|nr:hypothetical protein HELRODRAFT_183444 [Helobdella robusta]ESO11203.1 hypothetical protein HELRODRAFT_183444 [Helobdella robusta]
MMVATASVGASPAIDRSEIDARSIWIDNVDYGTSVRELKEHFLNCGAIIRVTILLDKYSGKPKGFAYIEFEDAGSVDLKLNQSLFRGRRPRGRGARTGRGVIGRGRSSYSTYVPQYQTFVPRFATDGQHERLSNRGRGHSRPRRTMRYCPY